MTSIYTTSTGSPMASLFGPVSKDYCSLFYIWSIITFTIALGHFLFFLLVFFGGKKYSSLPWALYLVNAITAFMQYLFARLFYTMCIT